MKSIGCDVPFLTRVVTSTKRSPGAARTVRFSPLMTVVVVTRSTRNVIAPERATSPIRVRSPSSGVEGGQRCSRLGSDRCGACRIELVAAAAAQREHCEAERDAKVKDCGDKRDSKEPEAGQRSAQQLAQGGRRGHNASVFVPVSSARGVPALQPPEVDRWRPSPPTTVSDLKVQVVGGRRARRRRDVAIAGFGKFSVTERAAHEGRNPATGEAIQIAARGAAKFSAAAARRAAAAAAGLSPAP